MSETNISDVYDHFAQRLTKLGDLVIAGGAVRDTLMDKIPKDYDLFLLNIPSAQFNETRELVGDRMKDLEVVKGLEWHQSQPYLCITVKWNGVDVQVLANPAPTAHSLIDSFDWNVCLFAYNRHFIAGEQIENIAPGKHLILHRVTYPLSTLRRGFRFSERFKLRLPRETVVDLSRKIVEHADAKNDIGPTGNEPDMPSLAASTLAT